MRSIRAVQPSRLPLVVLGEGAVVAVAQFVPLVTLSVSSYAIYAGIYLWYAALLAVTYAALADVWARARADGEEDPQDSQEERRYYAVLSVLSLLGVVTTFVGLWLLGQGILVVLGGAGAVGAAVFRAGSRYYLVGTGMGARSGLSDVAAATLTTVGVLLWLLGREYGLTVALFAWMIMSCISILGARQSPTIAPGLTVSWFKEHKRVIAAMSSEAGMMNLASITTPYVVAAIVGPAGLALLRSATSMAYPVRLVLSAARARVVGARGRGLRRLLVAAVLGGALAGAFIVGLLTVAKRYVGLADTAIGLVAEHAVVVGLYVLASAISSVLQLFARGRDAVRTLLLKRLAHTSAVLGGTSVAAAVWGISGAMWGAAMMTFVSAVLWAVPVGAVNQGLPRTGPVERKS